jgi:hypothetical protein
MITYPAFEELGTEPDYLLIGAAAMKVLHEYDYLKQRPSDRPPAPSARRPALSPYVGVTVHRGRYLGQYGQRGAVKTMVYPFTPEGERQAAIARALALGLPYLEKRDGTREAL